MKKLIIVLIAAILLPSCATILTAGKQSLKIDSNPAGASIEVNGMFRGTTPSRIRIKIKKDAYPPAITVKKEGYKSQNVTPGQGFQILSVLNFMNIIGWGVDVLTNSIHKCDPGYYMVRLEPENNRDIETKNGAGGGSDAGRESDNSTGGGSKKK
jgi:hypothetical protein